jgi:hypothetical protein
MEYTAAPHLQLIADEDSYKSSEVLGKGNKIDGFATTTERLWKKEKALAGNFSLKNRAFTAI